MWMTRCTGSRARGIWGDLKKSVRWELDSEREGSTFGARRGQTNLCTNGRHTCWGGGTDGKSQHRKICISFPFVKTFNSKVIKRYCTWTKKSLRVFRVSGFLCSMDICYEHSMYVSHIRISGYGTVSLVFELK